MIWYRTISRGNILRLNAGVDSCHRWSVALFLALALALAFALPSALALTLVLAHASPFTLPVSLALVLPLALNVSKSPLSTVSCSVDIAVEQCTLYA